MTLRALFVLTAAVAAVTWLANEVWEYMSDISVASRPNCRLALSIIRGGSSEVIVGSSSDVMGERRRASVG